MEKEKYVKLKHVQELLKLMETRDCYEWWSQSYKECDEKVENTIAWLENNSKEIDEIK